MDFNNHPYLVEYAELCYGPNNCNCWEPCSYGTILDRIKEEANNEILIKGIFLGDDDITSRFNYLRK